MKKVLFIISFFLFMPFVLAVETVETVPNEDIFVELDLFDYDIDDTIDNHPDHVMNTKFNIYSPLKFYGVGRNDNYVPTTQTPNPDRFTESEAVRQGMVEAILNDDGFPVLRNENHDSLDIVFNHAMNQFKRVYPNVKSLFVKKSEGFYYFDSNEFYAEFNPQTNDMRLTTPTFKLKNSLQQAEDEILYTGFFPFDTYNPNKNDVSPSMDLTWPANIYGGYNHHFGMHIKSKIYLPEDLKIDGKDMEFNFSGDDDIWIFLDGVLVLDLGGLHLPATGTINLTTGEVYVGKVYDDSPEGGHELRLGLDEIFTSVNHQFDRTKNSEHQFDIFYLERGGVYSNLRIDTNFWQPIDEPQQGDDPTPPDPTPQDPTPEEPTNDESSLDSLHEEKNPETSSNNIVAAIVLSLIVVFLTVLYLTDRGYLFKKGYK